jgi:hypothetical protein
MSYYNEDYDVEMVLGESDDEAYGNRKRQPRFNANRSTAYMQRPTQHGAASTSSVSQAFDKVGGDVRKLVDQNKDAESAQSRTNKRLQAINNDLQQTKMMSALFPLLLKPETLTLAANVGGSEPGSAVVLHQGDKLLKASDDKISMLLPLLLLMGGNFGGSESGTSSESNNNNNMMMMLVLVLALAGDKK